MTPITDRQNPQLAAMFDRIASALGHIPRTEAWERGICSQCQKPVTVETDFTNAASQREYWITATCQACQDVVFNDDEEDGNDCE